MSDQPPEQPEEKPSEELIEHRKKQTSDLINMLDELDPNAVPQMKPLEDKPVDKLIGVVDTPSFMKGISYSTVPAGANGLAPSSETNMLAEQATAISASVTEPVTPQGPQVPMNFLETEIATGEVFKDVQIFFKQLGKAYGKRYEVWEGTMSTILKILRKMQQNMAEDSEILVQAIEKLHSKIKVGLDNFVSKRNEVERFSDIDFKQVTKNFKKTLELLNFQIREFRLQQMISELYDIYV